MFCLYMCVPIFISEMRLLVVGIYLMRHQRVTLFKYKLRVFGQDINIHQQQKP